MTSLFEACPPGVEMTGPPGRQIPCYGGSLFFNLPEGRAGCPHCGWSGVPTWLPGPVISTWCPSCEHDPDAPVSAHFAPVRVSRNQPCPCGSGVKAKKCGCEEYGA